MCPACLASLSILIAGVVSTGGVTALAARALGRREHTRGVDQQESHRDEQGFPSPERKENQA